MEVIVVPRLLMNVLRDADESHAKLLALSFAEHALQVCSGVVTPVHLEVAQGYIAVTRDYVDGKESLSALGRVHGEYFAGRDGSDAQSERITWVAAVAVSAACQRDMEAARIVVKRSYVPSIVEVAQEAQAAVVLCTVGDHDGCADDCPHDRAHGVRWNEAKWQLTHTIETAPVPPGMHDH